MTVWRRRNRGAERNANPLAGAWQELGGVTVGGWKANVGGRRRPAATQGDNSFAALIPRAVLRHGKRFGNREYDRVDRLLLLGMGGEFLAAIRCQQGCRTRRVGRAPIRGQRKGRARLAGFSRSVLPAPAHGAPEAQARYRAGSGTGVPEGKDLVCCTAAAAPAGGGSRFPAAPTNCDGGAEMRISSPPRE